MIVDARTGKANSMKWLPWVVAAASFMASSVFAISVISFYPSPGTTGQCLDTPLRIELSTRPQIGWKGAIRIRNVETNSVEKTWNMVTNPGNPNTTSVAANWPWKDSVGVTYRNVWPVVLDSVPSNLAEIRIPKGLLKPNTKYQIELDAGVIKGTDGSELAAVAADSWTFTTGSAPTSKNSIVVAGDNSGDVCSIGRGLELVPSNSSTNVQVLVKPGYYREMIAQKSKNNLQLYGAGTDKTFLRYQNSNNLNEGSSTRSLLLLGGNNMSLRAFSVTNTVSVTGGQAEALYIQGDKNIVADVILHSFQDTWLNTGGNVYVQDATIEGSVDYIWGYNPVFFKRVTLVMNRAGSVIVQPRNAGETHGYVFDSCTIKNATSADLNSNFARDGGASYGLGEVIFLNTKVMNSSILNANPWSVSTNVDATKIRFCEYKSVDQNGSLISITNSGRLSRQCNVDTAAAHQRPSFVLGGWTPSVPSLSSVLTWMNMYSSATSSSSSVLVSSSSQVPVLPECGGAVCTSVLQGEDYCEANGVQEAKNSGFAGLGYVNPENSSGSAVGYVLQPKSQGLYTLYVRYANGGTTGRSMSLQAGGQTLIASVDFPSTGSWTTWDTKILNVNLPAGRDSLLFLSLTTDGGPNIDWIGWNSSGFNTATCQTSVGFGSQLPYAIAFLHGEFHGSEMQFSSVLIGSFQMRIRDIRGRMAAQYVFKDKDYVSTNVQRSGLYFVEIWQGLKMLASFPAVR